MQCMDTVKLFGHTLAKTCKKTCLCIFNGNHPQNKFIIKSYDLYVENIELSRLKLPLEN